MYKVGDIVHANNNYRWFSYSSDNYYNVKFGEAFKVSEYPDSISPSYIELKNVQFNYEILMSIESFDKFFNIRRLRKEKLERICQM